MTKIVLSNHPLVLEGLMACYNLLLAYRDGSSYSLKRYGGEWRNGQPFHPIGNKELLGNLGTCAIIDAVDGGVLSNAFIAPSSKLEDRVISEQRERFLSDQGIGCRVVTRLDTEDENRLLIEISYGDRLDESAVIEGALSCADSRRASDSEHLLLNIVHHGILVKEYPDEIFVVIVTERIPCSSCTKTIQKFLNSNPRAKLMIGYTFESKLKIDRQRNSFLAEFQNNGLSDRVGIVRVFVDGEVLNVF